MEAWIWDPVARCMCMAAVTHHCTYRLDNATKKKLFFLIVSQLAPSTQLHAFSHGSVFCFHSSTLLYVITGGPSSPPPQDNHVTSQAHCVFSGRAI
jgi:hypothetical protein